MRITTLGVFLGVLLCAGIFSVPAHANDAPDRLTFTKDVLPIMQENCQTCHRPAGRNMSGMVAPMSLMTYREVRPWAKAIVRAVESGEMPPWHATEATHGVFKNERSLSDKDRQTIISWVETGAARGNPADAPPAPEFPEGWYMGEPDMVITFDEPYFVEDDVEDLYHNITVNITEDMLPEDRWIKAMEFMPGSEVVHHVIAYATVHDDNGDPLNRAHLGGLAPGTDDYDYPEGYGKLLPANSEFTFAMHYHKEPGPGTGQYDNTKVAIKFHDKPVRYKLETSPVAHGDFEIPPFHPNWKVGGARVFEQPINIVALMPHSHLRGTAAKYTAVYPDGRRELLLDVPRYDFNWQTAYQYEDIKKLPAGTRIEWEVWYDNSKENAEQSGFNPARSVRFGRPTTDEMDLGWITYAVVDQGLRATETGD